MRRTIQATIATVIVLILGSSTASARLVRRYQPLRPNELSGGIGFAADLNDYTPGGFKWFNEYGRYLGGPVWLNVQFNVTDGSWSDCHYDYDGYRHCHGHWGGSAIELGVGAKFKWWVRRSPVQLHAKIGPALEFVWYDDYYDGTALAFRGGFGVRYFIVPTFSIGGEVVAAAGPMFTDFGTETYAAIDANFGVEFRF